MLRAQTDKARFGLILRTNCFHCYCYVRVRRMDLSPDELDVSPPCFLVEDSQADESQQLGRSDGDLDQHLSILKRLPIFRLSTRTDSSAGNSRNDLSVPRYPVVVTCPTAGGEGFGKEERDPSREQGDGDQQGEGGDSSGGGDDRGGDGGGDNGGGGGGEGGGGDAGGGGDGGGGDDDDDDNENNGQDPSTNEEESSHSEEPSSSSSSDAIPRLVRPEAVVGNNDQWKGQKVVVQVVQDAPLSGPDISHGSGGSVHESSDNYSQASTGIVGVGGDVAADASEASTAPVEEERKSTSSSSIGKTWVSHPTFVDT